MKILVAEDERDIALVYREGLEERNHNVVLTYDGEECLKIYNDDLQKVRSKILASMHASKEQRIAPSDVVILDYRMPKINGIEVAKEILAINPHQRIIFASAHLRNTLRDSIRQLNKAVELLQKPFDTQTLIDTVESKEIYDKLQELNIGIRVMKKGDFTHK